MTRRRRRGSPLGQVPGGVPGVPAPDAPVHDKAPGRYPTKSTPRGPSVRSLHDDIQQQPCHPSAVAAGRQRRPVPARLHVLVRGAVDQPHQPQPPVTTATGPRATRGPVLGFSGPALCVDHRGGRQRATQSRPGQPGARGCGCRRPDDVDAPVRTGSKGQNTCTPKFSDKRSARLVKKCGTDLCMPVASAAGPLSLVRQRPICARQDACAPAEVRHAHVYGACKGARHGVIVEGCRADWTTTAPSGVALGKKKRPAGCGASKTTSSSRTRLGTISSVALAGEERIDLEWSLHVWRRP